MEVLNLIKLFLGWVFPYISRIHTAYIGVSYFHFRYPGSSSNTTILRGSNLMGSHVFLANFEGPNSEKEGFRCWGFR